MPGTVRVSSEAQVNVTSRIRALERASRRQNLGRSWFKFSRNPLSVVGLVTVAAVILLAIFAPYVTPFPRHAGAFTDFAHAKIAPTARYVFGTDQIGRDILTRIVFGLRSSLLMAVLVLALVVPPACCWGCWQGTSGERGSMSSSCG